MDPWFELYVYHAMKALKGFGKKEQAMKELRKANPGLYKEVMKEAKERLAERDYSFRDLIIQTLELMRRLRRKRRRRKKKVR
jgi:uncharacterized tellurite resistance protein B-like protein